jgi:hypothetical protein
MVNLLLQWLTDPLLEELACLQQLQTVKTTTTEESGQSAWLPWLSLCDENDNSPIHLAMGRGWVQVTRVLLAHLSPLQHRNPVFNKQGLSPLFLAVQTHHHHLLELLLQHVATPEVLYVEGVHHLDAMSFAMIHGNVYACDRFLTAGYEIQHRNSQALDLFQLFCRLKLHPSNLQGHDAELYFFRRAYVVQHMTQPKLGFVLTVEHLLEAVRSQEHRLTSVCEQRGLVHQLTGQPELNDVLFLTLLQDHVSLFETCLTQISEPEKQLVPLVLNMIESGRSRHIFHILAHSPWGSQVLVQPQIYRYFCQVYAHQHHLQSWPLEYMIEAGAAVLTEAPDSLAQYAMRQPWLTRAFYLAHHHKTRARQLAELWLQDRQLSLYPLRNLLSFVTQYTLEQLVVTLV